MLDSDSYYFEWYDENTWVILKKVKIKKIETYFTEK